MPRTEWIDAFEYAGVSCATVNGIGEFTSTPQFAAEIALELPGGRAKMIGLPITVDRGRARRSPRLGSGAYGQGAARRAGPLSRRHCCHPCPLRHEDLHLDLRAVPAATVAVSSNKRSIPAIGQR